MIVIDFEAKAVSREAYLFAPIYRMNLTVEQFEKLEKDIIEKRGCLDESKVESEKRTQRVVL